MPWIDSINGSHVVTLTAGTVRRTYSWFSLDVTAAMLKPLNEETTAILGSKFILRELNSILMQIFFFASVRKHGC